MQKYDLRCTVCNLSIVIPLIATVYKLFLINLCNKVANSTLFF